MKLTEMQLYAAINEYLDREIMPLGANMQMLNQFMFGIQVGVLKRKIQPIVKNYLNNSEIKALELVDKDGKIDIDTLYNAAMDMFKQMKYIEIIGVRIAETDLQKLYGIMQKYVNSQNQNQ